MFRNPSEDGFGLKRSLEGRKVLSGKLELDQIF